MSARPVPDKFLVAFSFAGEQRDLVRDIALAVEKGLGWGTVFFDEWFEHYIARMHAKRPLQAIYNQRCELVVVCVSQEYGEKPWTSREFTAIRARRRNSRNAPAAAEQLDVLPLTVGTGKVAGIPDDTIAPDVRKRSAAASAQLIIDRLRLVKPDAQQGPGRQPSAELWLERPPDLVWPVADQSSVREAFGTLLTRTSPWSLLPIRGVSQTGKSLMTKQMLANVMKLDLRPIAYGRFDFKGTTGVADELNSFVQFLGVKRPEAKARLCLSDRLDDILEALKGRAAPSLLIFDTYEAAGDAHAWVENQLLPNLLVCPWLRMVIAGQRVPDAQDAPWRSAARATLELQPPPPQDWFDYGKQHRPDKPDLTLGHVEWLWGLGADAPVLAQLLGPQT